MIETKTYVANLKKKSPIIKAKKTGFVLARLGIEGEKIETYVSNGVTYTKYNIKDMYYKIAIKKKYFKKETQAKDFIKALSEYPVSRTKTIAKNLNYNSNLIKWLLYR